MLFKFNSHHFSMSIDRISISGPQSSAGILGISSNTNLGGIKFNPRGVVIFSAVFILIVKILDMLIASRIS
ncbi:MAG: preprotein translocase subunit Sec61beta [Candidatus Anstonellaceae archaeon]